MCFHDQGRELDLIELIGNRFADGKPALSAPATWLLNFLKRTMGGNPEAAAAIPPLVSPSASSTRDRHALQQTRGETLLPWT